MYIVSIAIKTMSQWFRLFIVIWFSLLLFLILVFIILVLVQSENFIEIGLFEAETLTKQKIKNFNGIQIHWMSLKFMATSNRFSNAFQFMRSLNVNQNYTVTYMSMRADIAAAATSNTADVIAATAMRSPIIYILF